MFLPCLPSALRLASSRLSDVSFFDVHKRLIVEYYRGAEYWKKHLDEGTELPMNWNDGYLREIRQDNLTPAPVFFPFRIVNRATSYRSVASLVKNYITSFQPPLPCRPFILRTVIRSKILNSLTVAQLAWLAYIFQSGCCKGPSWDTVRPSPPIRHARAFEPANLAGDWNKFTRDRLFFYRFLVFGILSRNGDD